jgi:hypothetical protein
VSVRPDQLLAHTDLSRRAALGLAGKAAATVALAGAVGAGTATPAAASLVKEGIRIGEGIVTDALAADGVYEFVYMYSPQNSRGATAGSTPPVALAQPRGR